MTSHEILKADVLDILFDNRNKLYGAYALRKNYNSRLSLALAISLSSMLLFFFLMRLGRSSAAPISHPPKEVVVVEKLIPPAIQKKEPAIPRKTVPVPQVRHEKLTTIQIKRDDLVKTMVPDQASLLNSIISNRTIEGIPSTNMPLPVEPEPPVVEQRTERQDPAREVVQKEPEFPGGPQAWLNFLRKNLVAPEELEPGEKKMVTVRFLVGADGMVTGFEVVQSGGESFNHEVIRVLKKMPRWKPAIQNGQPIARAFTQPVTFIGAEQ